MVLVLTPQDMLDFISPSPVAGTKELLPLGSVGGSTGLRKTPVRFL